MATSGWICPKCDRVLAPHVEECRACSSVAATSPTVAGPTFAELWKRYGEWAQRHQATSWKGARSGHGFHLLKHFGSTPWNQITHAQIDAYVDGRRQAKTRNGGRAVKPATINHEVASGKKCINHCLSPAVRAIKGQNPFDKYPELPVVMDRRFHLTEADFVKLLEHSRPLLRLMLIFSFETGMRRDEFRCLEWAEVDIEQAVVNLPAERTKAKRAREIPLSDVALSVLKAVPRFARSTYVFENPKGNNKPVAETTLYEWFCKARDESGVKGPKEQAVWVHTLRKSFGTIQAMSGMPIYQLMDVMGHSSAEVHFEYTKMSPDYRGVVRQHMNRRIGPQPSPPAKEPASAERPASPLLQFVRGGD